MSLPLEEVDEASFRGTPFLMRRGSLDFARKTISHEYVNKDERFVEDLGLDSDKFTVVGIITGPNYYQKRNALLRALRESGPGQLVHPFHGTRTVAVTSVSLDEDLRNLGVATFNIEFEQTLSSATYPVAENSVQQQLLTSADDVADIIAQDIASEFMVTIDFPENFDSAREKVQGVIDSLSSTVNRNSLNNTLETGLNTVASFKDSLNDFQTTFESLILNPTELGRNIVSLFTDMQNLTDNPSTRKSINKSFTEFGQNDDFREEKTFEREERNRNKRIINGAMRAMALANLYDASGQDEFFSVVELDNNKQLLENRYQNTIRSDNVDLSSDVLEQLQVSRNLVREFFKNQRTTAYRINQVTTKQLPLTVLSYKYYGSTGFTEQLQELNGVAYTPAVEGDLQVFTK